MKSNLTFLDIEKAVLKKYHLTYEELRLRTRKREIVTPRQAAMYLSVKLIANQPVSIGVFFGGFSNATVLNAVEAIQNLIDTDKKFRDEINDLIYKLEIQRPKKTVIANDIRALVSRMGSGNITHFKGSLLAIANTIEEVL